jgi:hypothetical protein
LLLRPAPAQCCLEATQKRFLRMPAGRSRIAIHIDLIWHLKKLLSPDGSTAGTKGNLDTLPLSVGIVGGGRAVLYRISKRVAGFYRHAYECNEKARKARELDEREFFLDMERRWLSLAHQSDLTERLVRIAQDIARRYKETARDR